MRGGETSWPAWIIQCQPCRNALSGIKGGKIGGIQKMGIIGSHHRQIQLFGQPEGCLQQTFLIFFAIPLQFQIKAFGKPVCIAFCQQFSLRMIAAQRGYEANSKIVTTADQLLGELINLKR